MENTAIELPKEAGQKITTSVVIESIEDRNARTKWIKVAGITQKFAAWSNVAEKIGVGESAEAEIECKEEKGYNGGPNFNLLWLNTFGEVGKRTGGAKGGRGGGYTPKTPEEIHSASVCGIIKSCVESGHANGWTLDQICEISKRLISVYRDEIGGFRK